MRTRDPFNKVIKDLISEAGEILLLIAAVMPFLHWVL